MLGGAASGKSTYAERLISACGRPRLYIATAEAHDDEMRAKIADHRRARGPGWQTIEAPHDLAGALAAAPEEAAVLIDCATLWLSNRLLAGGDLAAERAGFLDALAASRQPVVVVSNEVGAGIVPENALARRFRNEQGALNKALAGAADRAIVMFAGLPLALKGDLPELPA